METKTKSNRTKRAVEKTKAEENINRMGEFSSEREERKARLLYGNKNSKGKMSVPDLTKKINPAPMAMPKHNAPVAPTMVENTNTNTNTNTNVNVTPHHHNSAAKTEGIMELLADKKRIIQNGMRKLTALRKHHDEKCRSFSLNHVRLRVDSAKAVIFQEAIALQELANSIENKDQQKALIHALHLFERAQKDDAKVVVTGMGKSGHIGTKIATTLSSMGTPSFFLHPAEASHGDLGMIGKKDVLLAISNTGETKELFDVLDYCKQRKIPIIGMTHDAKSHLGQTADVLLLIPKVAEACPIGKAPTTSTTMCLVLGDALAVVMAERWGFDQESYKGWHPGGKLGATTIMVQDVYNKGNKPLVVLNNDLVSDVAKLFQKTDQKDILIAVTNKKGMLIGQISATNIVKVLTNNTEEVERLFAEDIMEKCVSVDVNQHIFDASKIMHTAKISSCLVTKDNQPIAMINLNDLLRTTSY